MASDREFSVILERIYSEIRVLGEGQSSLDRRLSSTQSMVAQNAEGITRNGMLIKANHELILKLDQRLSRVEDHLALTEA